MTITGIEYFFCIQYATPCKLRAFTSQIQMHWRFTLHFIKSISCSCTLAHYPIWSAIHNWSYDCSSTFNRLNASQCWHFFLVSSTIFEFVLVCVYRLLIWGRIQHICGSSVWVWCWNNCFYLDHPKNNNFITVWNVLDNMWARFVIQIIVKLCSSNSIAVLDMEKTTI